MVKKHWNELTNDEKLDRLTSVLTKAGSDIHFRDRCLVSPESAKQAVAEIGNVEFPKGFKVRFITSEEEMNTLVLKMPDFIPAKNGDAETRQAEDFQKCTYVTWRA